jgi:hypothetical protein
MGSVLLSEDSGATMFMLVKINDVKRIVTVLTFCLSLFALPLFAAESDGRGQIPLNSLLPQSSERVPNRASPLVSQRQASDLARENFDGRILNIRRDDNNWRVRMDSEGTVFNVFVNATTGNVSRSSE